jgi:Holliday junction resolvase RusA-like endonuclease
MTSRTPMTPAAQASRDLIVKVHGKPAPQGSKRHVGRGVLIEESKRVAPWREAVKWAVLASSWTPEDYPLDGPVRVEVTFCFNKSASAPKRRRSWPVKRSTFDVDKLLRSIFDALVDAGVFRDDCQVIDVRARKVYVDDPASPLATPGAVIRVVQPLDESEGV